MVSDDENATTLSVGVHGDLAHGTIGFESKIRGHHTGIMNP